MVNDFKHLLLASLKILNLKCEKTSGNRKNMFSFVCPVYVPMQICSSTPLLNQYFSLMVIIHFSYFSQYNFYFESKQLGQSKC